MRLLPLLILLSLCASIVSAVPLLEQCSTSADCDTVGATCQNGLCACHSSLSRCLTECKDLSVDEANCGTCGKACQATEVCQFRQGSSTCGACPVGSTVVDQAVYVLDGKTQTRTYKFCTGGEGENIFYPFNVAHPCLSAATDPVDPLKYCLQNDQKTSVVQAVPSFDYPKSDLKTLIANGKLSMGGDKCAYSLPLTLSHLQAQCVKAECGISFPVGSLRRVNIYATQLPTGATLYFKVCDGSFGRTAIDCTNSDNQLLDQAGQTVTKTTAKFSGNSFHYSFATRSTVDIMFCAKLDFPLGFTKRDMEASEMIEAPLTPVVIVEQTIEFRPTNEESKIRISFPTPSPQVLN